VGYQPQGAVGVRQEKEFQQSHAHLQARGAVHPGIPWSGVVS